MLSISVLGSLVLKAVLARSFTDTVTTLLVGGTLTLGYVIELAVVRAVSTSRGQGFRAAIGLVRPAGSSTVAWIAIATGGAVSARVFAALYALLVERFGLHLPGASSDPLSLFPGGGISVVVLLAVVVLIAPFAEEVIFRGVLLPALGVGWGTLAGLLASSALFAAFHLSPYLLLPIFAASLVFGWLAIRFRSLWPSYLAHAVFNGTAAVLVLFLKSRGLV